MSPTVPAQINAPSWDENSGTDFIFENINDAIFIHDLAGKLFRVNQIACRQRGYTREELLAIPITQLDSPDNAARYPERIRAIVQNGQLVLETEHRRKDGSWMPVEVNARLIQFNGAPAVLSVIRDMTERKRIEATLRHAEEKYRNIFENAVEGIFQSTPDGSFISVNAAMARIYGYASPEDLIASVGNAIAHKVYADPDRRAEFMRRLEEQGVAQNFEAQNRRKDGTLIWTNTHARAVRDARGTLLYYEGFVEDITERKHLEKTLQSMLDAQRKWNADLENKVRAKTAELRQLSETRDRLLRQIIVAQEDEHRRVARELHDETSQALTALIANLATAQTLPAPKAKAQLDEIKAAVVEILKGVNQIVLDLRPTLLDDYGLMPALSWYANKRLGARVRVEITTPEPELRLPATIETTLFRIGQEALANIAKHAKARCVRMSLSCAADGNQVTLQVADDGVGFFAERVKHCEEGGRVHLGLLGMQERVQLIGGQLQIDTAPGKGTVIAARVPVRAPVSEE